VAGVARQGLLSVAQQLAEVTGGTLHEIPFATSGGSSIKKACEDLKATYPDVNWKEGKLWNRASKKDLEDWVKKQ